MSAAPKNFQSNYQAVYGPATPNVYISFTCEDEQLASELQLILLHLSGPWSPDQSSGITFPGYCTVRHGSVKDSRRIDVRCLFVWYHIPASVDAQPCEILDLGGLTPQMDFEFEATNGIFNLNLKHAVKFHYAPLGIGEPYWPPPSIERNLEGGPASTAFGIDTDDDVLIMRAPVDKALELFNKTIANLSGCETKKWFQVDHISHSKVSRRTKLVPSQLTFWDNAGSLYCLLRQSSSNKDGDEPSQRWRAWFLTGSHVSHARPPATFSQKNEVTLEGLDIMVGEYLSLDSQPMLLPMPSNRGLEQSTSERTKIELKFHAEEVEKLRALFHEYGIS